MSMRWQIKKKAVKKAASLKANAWNEFKNGEFWSNVSQCKLHAQYNRVKKSVLIK